MSGTFDDVYSQCYELLYRDKDYATEAAYVANCLKLHGLQSGAILDLGCGTGKHARELARMGYTVVGVDKSAGMITIANQSRHGITGQTEFVVGDVRTYRTGRVFGAVVSLFHVISYQKTNEDLVATFETAAHHLPRGGMFLFDCWYGPAVLTVPPKKRVKRVEDETITVTRTSRPLLDVRRNTAVIDYTVLVESSDRELRDREIHHMRYLFEPEIEELFKRTGFEACDAHEWGTGRQLGTDTWSAAFLAKKR